MDLSPTFVRELEGIVGARGIVSSPEGRLTYEADMHTFYKGQPDLVVLPETAEQTAAIVRLCRREKVPVVPRGSGTGLIGGAMAPAGGVMVAMNRMNRILELDFPNRCAVVATGPDQPLAERGHARARLLLRARPVEPDGVVDRRELLDQCRRPSLPQVRDHGEPRARAPGGDRGGRARLARRQGAGPAGVRLDRWRWSARRGRSGS